MSETLGAFEQAVLLTILRLGEGAYGRVILDGMQERLSRELAAGAVHATLVRLERKGLVTSRIGAGTAVRAGRPRRFYRLEPDGYRALNEARAAVEQLWEGIGWPLRTPR